MNDFMCYSNDLSLDELVQIEQNILDNIEQQEKFQAEQNEERKKAYDNTL